MQHRDALFLLLFLLFEQQHPFFQFALSCQKVKLSWALTGKVCRWEKKYKWGFLGRGAWTGHTHTRYAIPLPPPKSLLGHKALFVNKMFSFSLLSIEFNCPTFCKPTSFLRFFSSFASWNIQLGTLYIHRRKGLVREGVAFWKWRLTKTLIAFFIYTVHLSGL